MQCARHRRSRAPGHPGVFVASSEFVEAAAAQSKALGFPAVARVFTPHPIQDRTDDEMVAYADAAYEDIVAASPPERSRPFPRRRAAPRRAPLGGDRRAIPSRHRARSWARLQHGARQRGVHDPGDLTPRRSTAGASASTHRPTDSRREPALIARRLARGAHEGTEIHQALIPSPRRSRGYKRVGLALQLLRREPPARSPRQHPRDVRIDDRDVLLEREHEDGSRCRRRCRAMPARHRDRAAPRLPWQLQRGRG